MKVVCIKCNWSDDYGPRVNEIVTVVAEVIGYTNWGNEAEGYELKEYPLKMTSIGLLRGFIKSAFRPVLQIGDEVEEYISEKVRKEQTVEA